MFKCVQRPVPGRWYLALVALAAAPSCLDGCRGEEARALDERLRASEEVIRTVSPWNRGREAGRLLADLPILQWTTRRSGPADWISRVVIELAPNELRINEGRGYGLPAASTAEDSRQVERTIADAVELELAGASNDARITLLVHGETPTARVMTVIEEAAASGHRRLDLAFRRARPPMIERASPSPELATVITQQTVGPTGAITYPDLVFRDCPSDWEPVAAAPPSDDELTIKREKMVEAYGGWRCDADPNDIEWLFQRELPAIFLHLIAFELSKDEKAAIFVDPSAPWSKSATELAAVIGPPAQGQMESPHPIRLLRRGGLGGLEILAVRGARGEEKLQRLLVLGRLLPKCAPTAGAGETADRAWDLELTISADGQIEIIALSAPGGVDGGVGKCLARYLTIVDSISHLPPATGPTTVSARLTLK